MKVPIPILSVVAVAAIAATACSVPPTIYDTGPSPADCTQGPGEAPCPGGAGVWRPPDRPAVAAYEHQRILAAKREAEANAAAGMPPGVDRGLAEAAVKDGVPMVFELAAGSDACGQVLRLPDRSLWSLDTGGALTRNTSLEQTLARWGGALPGYACQPGAVTTVPPFDATAADAANHEGKPYRWRDPDGCSESVRIPGSNETFEVPDAVTVRGDALRTRQALVACGGGYGAPTSTPKGN
ncbi:hypothetical protein [Mycobacteroides chelonae]|uniref:hypothetical protein n=1 Tax=Mycobacteroides chelonae TaxID=1774 RepID=UPI0018B08E39|nr:hypothetical protein [Mycobacteroides chelonae]MBF9519502.1 hypothetical protein [Mycobacteroides chelonae]